MINPEYREIVLAVKEFLSSGIRYEESMAPCITSLGEMKGTLVPINKDSMLFYKEWDMPNRKGEKIEWTSALTAIDIDGENYFLVYKDYQYETKDVERILECWCVEYMYKLYDEDKEL